jgi:hypothetical protein
MDVSVPVNSNTPMHGYSEQSDGADLHARQVAEPLLELLAEVLGRHRGMDCVRPRLRRALDCGELTPGEGARELLELQRFLGLGELLLEDREAALERRAVGRKRRTWRTVDRICAECPFVPRPELHGLSLRRANDGGAFDDGDRHGGTSGGSQHVSTGHLVLLVRDTRPDRGRFHPNPSRAVEVDRHVGGSECEITLDPRLPWASNTSGVREVASSHARHAAAARNHGAAAAARRNGDGSGTTRTGGAGAVSGSPSSASTSADIWA